MLSFEYLFLCHYPFRKYTISNRIPVLTSLPNGRAHAAPFEFPNYKHLLSFEIISNKRRRVHCMGPWLQGETTGYVVESFHFEWYTLMVHIFRYERFHT